MLTLAELWQRCESRGLQPQQNRNGKEGFSCFCPVHGDTKTRHLYVSVGYKALVFWCAHGCGFAEIAAALDLERQECRAPDPTRRLDDGAVTHDYRDAMGRLKYQTWRQGSGKGKKVRRRRPDGSGGWIWNLEGVELILYRLPELTHADPAAVVLIGEGEKVADTLSRTGNPATTNVGGAKQWRDHYADALIGRRVAVFPDCDADGEFWAEQVTASLKKRAIRFGVVRLEGLSEGQDAYDWLRMGHEPAELLALAERAAGTYVVNVVLSSPNRIIEPPSELEPEALFGLPGEVVLTIEPHTESHPAAILASFLTGAGCLIGSGPFVYRDGARHGVNEFALLVGLTAKGRKGTATRRVDELFSYSINSNSTFLSMHETEEGRAYRDLLLPGLGSGEALVAALAEEEDDYRRLVFEEEFSRSLKVMRREGSTLSENLRAAWDGGLLASRTKGRKMLAKRHHVSILGHITEEELRLELGSVSIFNGFANRFLWFCTQRTKSLPFGGGEPPIARVVKRFHDTLDYVRTIGKVEFDEEAAAVWGEGGVYDLLTERPKGLLGAVTGRAEAHVTRLALLYAVLDADREIRLPHLLAALAVWDYSEKSCAYLFGTSSGDDYADTLLELLADAYPGGLTRTEIRDKFHRNAVPGRIPKALAMLEATGQAEPVEMAAEKGRPTQVWRLVVPDENAQRRRQNDINDKSPLLRARKLAQEIREGSA